MVQRSQRLAEVLLQELSRLVKTVKDPGLSGFLTLTDLDLSKDLKTADVFFSVLGTPEDRQASAKALHRASSYLRHELRERMKLKYIPKLEFHYDATPERADRIERLLGHIEAERRQSGNRPPTAA